MEGSKSLENNTQRFVQVLAKAIDIAKQPQGLLAAARAVGNESHLQRLIEHFRAILEQTPNNWIPKAEANLVTIIRACVNKQYEESDIESEFYLYGGIEAIIALHLATTKHNFVFGQIEDIPEAEKIILIQDVKGIVINELLVPWILSCDRSPVPGMLVRINRHIKTGTKRKRTRESLSYRNFQPKPSSSTALTITNPLSPSVGVRHSKIQVHIAFKNWNDRGIEHMFSNLMTLEEAENDPLMRLKWQGKLPCVSRQAIKYDISHLVGVITSQTADQIKKGYTPVRMGDMEGGDREVQLQRMGCALYQISLSATEMAETIPCTISNIMVPDLLPSHLHSQTSYLEIFPDEGLSCNVTPGGTFTDLHIDSCTVGQAICLGRCVKTFFCFPPTTKNLELWKDHLGLAHKLFKYGSILEYGIIVRTGNDILSTGNCIDMSSGTIHSVLTNEGGLLVGFNYSINETLLLSSNMICMQFRRWQQDTQIVEDVQWYRKSLKAYFLQPSDQTYPVTWYSLVLLLNECDKYPHRNAHKAFQEIRKAEKDNWPQWKKLHEGPNGTIDCVCGKQYTFYRDHYIREECPAVKRGIELSHWANE